MISRGLQGDASLPPGFVPQDTATLSETNAQRDIGLRQSLGEQLLPTFTTQHEHLNRVLAGLSPQDWERPCWHPRRGAISVHAYAELRIQELAMHGWDIRSSFLPPPQAHLNPRCTPILMGMVPPWLRMSFRPGPRLISPIRYRFEVFQTLGVTGPVSHSHDVGVEGDDFGVESTADVDKKADVAFRSDTETYLLFTYGRLSMDSTIAAGGLTLEGDRGLGAQFERWFKGI